MNEVELYGSYQPRFIKASQLPRRRETEEDDEETVRQRRRVRFDSPLPLSWPGTIKPSGRSAYQ